MSTEESPVSLRDAPTRRLTMVEGRFNIVDSVFAGAEGADFPLLITTSDNCLVTAEGYAEFIDKALAAEAGAAAALARKEDVIAADPVGLVIDQYGRTVFLEPAVDDTLDQGAVIRIKSGFIRPDNRGRLHQPRLPMHRLSKKMA